MERDADQMSQSQSLCRSGCGFYGSSKTDGLCSKCYKDVVKRKQSNPSPPVTTGRSSPTIASPVPAASTSGTKEEKAGLNVDLSSASPTVPSASAVSTSHDQAIPDECKDASKTECENESKGPSSVAKAEAVNASGAASEAADALPKESKPKKNRCEVCRKKVGLTGFSCRCSGLFCAVHRYSDEHNCTFDYKELGAQEIRKNNPRVIGEKVKKI